MLTGYDRNRFSVLRGNDNFELNAHSNTLQKCTCYKISLSGGRNTQNGARIISSVNIVLIKSLNPKRSAGIYSIFLECYIRINIV